jgi:hypothetical protein
MALADSDIVSGFAEVILESPVGTASHEGRHRLYLTVKRSDVQSGMSHQPLFVDVCSMVNEVLYGFRPAHVRRDVQRRIAYALNSPSQTSTGRIPEGLSHEVSPLFYRIRRGTILFF